MTNYAYNLGFFTQNSTPLTTQPSLHHVLSSPSHYITKPICTPLSESESERCKSARDANLTINWYTLYPVSLDLQPTVVTVVTFLTNVFRDAIVLALYIQSLSAKMARDHHPRFPLPRRYLLLPLWVNLLHRHRKRPAVKSRLFLRLKKPEHKLQNLHALASNKYSLPATHPQRLWGNSKSGREHFLVMCMRGSKKKTWEKNTEMKEAESLLYALESSSQVSAYKLSNAQRAGA